MTTPQDSINSQQLSSPAFKETTESEFDDYSQNSHFINPNIIALGLAKIGINSVLDALDKGETAKKESRQPVLPNKAYEQLNLFNTTHKVIEEKTGKK
ncbi:hypothetical protein ENU1_142520 [Entamoeba nuttalli P19]|uniref:Uncharacterized protein n=1 Tax=Entamoeba nuttalli (strain P19) TaxID=1076696 RepID=K2GYY6_ENTNP|nr:hypothetical protein ENU1_142520 [Entamoeba nuttalli P19]EKE39072.1 hypothetical protein ENU1_142520 [Entamoeba nuttalli P19]|eukprot:XP_008858592.1 hypothetical protein ENU1_142520 [Entamoeba nuttalli P19]